MMLMLRLLLVVVIPVTVFGQVPPPGFVRWGGSELADRQAALTSRVGSDASARETLTVETVTAAQAKLLGQVA